MGLYKELHYELEQLYKQQQQIYIDAADTGIFITSMDDPVCKKIRMLLEEPIMAGGLNQHRTESRDRDCVEVDIVLYLPWESIGDQNRCTKWNIIFYKDLIKGPMFISLHSSSSVASDDDVWS